MISIPLIYVCLLGSILSAASLLVITVFFFVVRVNTCPPLWHSSPQESELRGGPRFRRSYGRALLSLAGNSGLKVCA